MANGVFDLQIQESTKTLPVHKVSNSYISGKDGTSNTLLLSERANYDASDLANRRGWATVGTLANITSTTGYFDLIEDELGFYVPTAVWPSDAGGSFPYINTEAQGSTIFGTKGVLFSGHPGVVVASFCDGRSTTLNKDIDALVFLHLITPDRQESLSRSY